VKPLEKTQTGNAPGKSVRVRETTLRELNHMAATMDTTFSEVARELIDGALELLHDPKAHDLPTPLMRIRQRMSEPPRVAPPMPMPVDMAAMQGRVTADVTAGVLAALQAAGVLPSSTRPVATPTPGEAVAGAVVKAALPAPEPTPVAVAPNGSTSGPAAAGQKRTNARR